jgi:lipid-A-disaccharide synthase
MNIVLICTERSGENLLHSYLHCLSSIYPQAHFYCQTSRDRWISEGYHNKENMHFLSDRSLCTVMGLIDPIKRLWPLYQRMKFLKKTIQHLSPQLVIGFVGPDFCLKIEDFAKQHQSYVVHVVSPSVWAWRSGRIDTVDKSAHELHYLFDFEGSYYQSTQLHLEHIGHPIVRTITPVLRRERPKTLLLAPGSRFKEVHVLLPFFYEMALCLKAMGRIEQIVIAQSDDLPVDLYAPYRDHAIIMTDFYQAIMNSDFAIACSGTATLEIAAHGCPLIVVYPINSWKRYLLSWFIQTPFFALPNIISGFEVCAEFIGNLKNMRKEIMELLGKSLEKERYPKIAATFYDNISQKVHCEKTPCLQQILLSLSSRVSMKQAEVRSQVPL